MEQNLIPSIFDELEQQIKVEYATSLERLGHYFVDGAVIYCINRYLFGVRLFTHGVSISLVSFGISTITTLVYYTVMEGAMGGRSLGKFLTGSVAVHQDFRQLTLKDAWIRSLCRIIPFEAISVISGHWWHDSLSHTYVIKKGSVRRF